MSFNDPKLIKALARELLSNDSFKNALCSHLMPPRDEENVNVNATPLRRNSSNQNKVSVSHSATVRGSFFDKDAVADDDAFDSFVLGESLEIGGCGVNRDVASRTSQGHQGRQSDHSSCGPNAVIDNAKTCDLHEDLFSSDFGQSDYSDGASAIRFDGKCCDPPEDVSDNDNFGDSGSDPERSDEAFFDQLGTFKRIGENVDSYTDTILVRRTYDKREIIDLCDDDDSDHGMVDQSIASPSMPVPIFSFLSDYAQRDELATKSSGSLVRMLMGTKSDHGFGRNVNFDTLNSSHKAGEL